ncbi:receptor-like protein EIX2 isoform X2 [Euphorbia lathyris]
MEGCNESDREALLDFKKGLADSENRISSWQGRDCCTWWGIDCDNNFGAVVKVDLHNPYPSNYDYSGRYGLWNLSGEIRPSLIKLKSLRYLDLSFNTFNGRIPDFISFLWNLQYLNLSNAGFDGEISPSLGNLSRLQFLDVSSNNFPGLSARNIEWIAGLISIKHIEMTGSNLSMVGSGWVNAFNRLPNLIELHLSACGLSSIASSLTSVNFTSLAVLDLSSNSLNSMFPNWLVNISSLKSVDLSLCDLYGRIPLGFGDLPNLQLLNLGNNDNLTASCNQLFKGSWRSIEFLDFSINKLHGRLPASIGNMTLLTHLDLFHNAVKGGIPGSIGGLCNLQYLDLSANNLTGSLPEFLEGMENCPSKSPFPSLQYLIASDNQLVGHIPDWLGHLKNLLQLNLQWNSLQGPIPASLGNLNNLEELRLEANKLNGTLPVSLGQLPQLSVLDVSINELTGVVSEAHFIKLHKLQILLLSANSFFLNVSSNWIPPFQLMYLEMGSCHVGPSFPEWLRSQKEIQYVHFPNASISGSIPDWFWDMSGNLSVLNVSLNQLQGQLPNPLNIASFALVDLSSNLFHGSIPLPLFGIKLFDLSRNKFSGPIPENIGKIMPELVFLSFSNNQLTAEVPASIGEMTSLEVIDFSSNYLTGSIPSSIGNCSLISVLDFQKNNLSGEIPGSISKLNLLQTLHLSNNRFSGEILPILQNLSSLETIDLGSNNFTGRFPTWIGEAFPHLRILSLRSNNFFGEIPPALSNLNSLQVLDLAKNEFNSKIPASFGNLKAMSQKQSVNINLFYGSYMTQYYKENLLVCISGQPQVYTKTLSLVTTIDLSGNVLHGEIPEEISKLEGLLVLNLSRNHISGQIPEKISELRELISFDLSENSLSGAIPPSISSMTFLAYLNVSDNNLSGPIPYTNQMTTFEASSFSGNPGLCGGPLAVKCVNDRGKSGTWDVESKNGDSLIDRWFYLSIGVGYAAGLLVPYLIITIRRSWADIYFSFVDKTARKLSSLRITRAATARRRIMQGC